VWEIHSESNKLIAGVSFNSYGTLLVVTEKLANRLDTYTVDRNGVASVPTDNPSSGMTPFGFSFYYNDVLIVSEAFGGAPNPYEGCQGVSLDK
jgi:6-phosphogluconolactonase